MSRPDAVLPRLDPAAPVPLSYWQEAMWLTDQLRGARALSAPALCVRIRGPVREDALWGALDLIVRRHEVLRTTYDIAGDEPVQIVHSGLELDRDVVDLAGADEQSCAAVCAEQVRRGFDLRAEPPVRSRLYRLASRDHVLLVARHHIAFDGQSNEILAREFAAGYQALAAGRQAELPPLPVQYADVALWQRARFAADRTGTALAHWRERLDGVPGSIPLPFDRPRAARGRGVGLSFSVPVPAALAERVPAVARACRATPFMLLLAAFRLALWQYTGQPDSVVATPVDSRGRPETQPLIGCFLDTVLLPGTAAGDPTGYELIARERAGALDAFAHQDLPYPLLSRALERQAPTIQVTFAYQGRDQPYPLLSGLTVTSLDLERVVCLFDVMVKVVRNERGMRLQIAYDDDVFDERTVRPLADQFLTALDALLADPDAPASRLGEPRRPVPHGAAAPPPAVLMWTTGAESAAPSGPVQELVAGLWADLLGADPPGVDVGIFDCGGHSLTLAKLAVRLREALGIEVAVADLMAHQTIAAQASLLEKLLIERLGALDPERTARLLSDDPHNWSRTVL